MRSTLVGLAFFLSSVPALSQQSTIPGRIHNGGNPDLMVMTLGNVSTPLAQGQFDPTSDRFRMADGRTIDHYYRDSLRIAFYAPIDKTIFPLPPSGWCSWYYYYQDIDEHEVKLNAAWIAENLKAYGAEYVQIDDGWQGSGHGLGGNRDWTTIDRRFPGGMDGLASFIRNQGLKAGLWLAPHGQSNEQVVRNNPGVFLLRPDDSTASNTWEGTYLVDPSTSASHRYLANLFSTLSGWGYDYFKIDGQPIVVNEFRSKKSFMKHPAGNTDSLYRSTLRSIRSAIGKNRYLLGCWGIPLEGAGIMNGSRTGGDVDLGWPGFRVALSATMQYYFLHNVVWYCDPDVMLLRSPLTISQARAWATLQGLTGQALMDSDRLMDLSSERVDILRRVYPAVDIRPLDLFPSTRDKHIWDLKISHLGVSYDVVGIFNYDETAAESRFLRWSDLGLPANKPMHVFDFWNKEYLGAWEGGIALPIEPTSCRVLTIMPMEDHPQLVSTSRHITQGWVDLVSSSYDRAAHTYRGKSRVVRNDPYELRFAFPRGTGMAVSAASADGLPVRISNHQGWATVEFTPPSSGVVNWRVTFAPAPYYRYQPHTPYGLTVQRVGIDGADIRWSSNYYLNTGFELFLGDSLLGYAPSTTFPLRGLNPDSLYTVALRTVWQDGQTSLKAATLQFSTAALLPDRLWLSTLEPASATVGYATLQRDKSISGGPLTLGGSQYEHGLGTHANSDIAYDLHQRFGQFNALVGVDDDAGKGRGSVEFIVLGDGKPLWKSGIMKQGDAPKRVDVSLDGVRTLLLRVTDAADGIDYDHADWVNPQIVRSDTSKHGK